MSDVVAREVAEADLERVMTALELDTSQADLNEEEKKGARVTVDSLVRAVMRGKMSVDEEARLVLHLPSGNLTFNHPTGATFMAMDRRKDHEKMSKMVSVMASLTGREPVFFSKMKAADFKLCSEVVALFLS